MNILKIDKKIIKNIISLYRHENFTPRGVKFFKKLFLYDNELIIVSGV